MRRRPTEVMGWAILGMVLMPGTAGATDTSTASAGLPTIATSTSGLAAPDFDAVFDDPVDSPEPDTFRPPPLFIEAIEVVGRSKTARATILSRLSVGVGDLVDESRIEESRLRLLGTGFFKTVEFSLRRGSERGRVLLVVAVQERNTIQIDELYLGFSTLSPFFGGFSLTETNFLGQGVTVAGSLVAGRDRRGLELRLFVPSLSGTQLQLSMSTILLQGAEVLLEDLEENDALLNTLGARRDRLLTGEDALRYQRLGGTLGFGLQVGPSQRVSLIYRLESVRADRLPNLDPAVLRQAPSIQFDESVLSSLTALYERDTRDDPFVPLQGSRIALGVEMGTSLIGSTYEFSKYTVEAQKAFSPVSDHSFIIHAFGGLIQGQTPFFNQFFLSDFAPFAWNRDSLPRNVQLNFSESNDYDDLVASLSTIYSIPIYGGDDLVYSMYVYGSLNLGVTASLDELQEDPRGRGAAGQFPLSFDFGLKIDTWVGNFTMSLSYMSDLVF